ncbi:hypothetical protein B0T16DRAFT_385417 [Cercophora newfieldiana]|uniref:Uncharacterized protein n=1 Tax=Cercophora newfieldiana TaxID=92897 RepID=A0AA39YQG0_9PEZI|nr:hypothetical protein B0T16DRAFT_385417 [Cercophora newfieldiana]
MSDNTRYTTSGWPFGAREDIEQQYSDLTWTSVVPSENRGSSLFGDQTQTASLSHTPTMGEPWSSTGTGESPRLYSYTQDHTQQGLPPFYEQVVDTEEAGPDASMSMLVEPSHSSGRSPLNDDGRTSQLSIPDSSSMSISMPAHMAGTSSEVVSRGASRTPKGRRRKQGDTRQESRGNPRTYLAGSNDVGAAMARVDSLFPARTERYTSNYPSELSDVDSPSEPDNGAGSDFVFIPSDGSEWDYCDQY